VHGLLHGVALMTGATALFTTMNTGVKVLSAGLPVAQLVWARNLVHLLFVVALFGPGRGGWRLFATRCPAVQFSRSLLFITSTACFFAAIGHVPLADATAIGFTAPLVVALLAGPVLGERLRPDHWVAIGVGFAGALIVVRPTGAGASPYALLVVASSAAYAGYQLLTRRAAAVDSPETSVAYSALLGTVLTSAVVPWHWATPSRPWQWTVLGGLGLLGGVGHYMVARAFGRAPASLVSPFHYVQLLWAAVAGYVLFGDVPGALTWLGAALIIASGLYIAWQGSG
jgi:drug/metabolite transporter (DMT)-like permease